MYVLVDMEWISNQHGNHWPTQLAAARVDAQWNTVDTFSVLFRPRDFSLQQWGHMAFSGWSREQFLDGESLYAGLDAFRLWLQPEDTICWWHQEASDLFNMFSKVSGVPDMTQHVVLLCDYIYGYLPKELFLSTLEKIQKQEARIDEFNTALSKICDGVPVFDSENQYLIALRELLKYTMQDQYDYIGWWLYEAPDAGYTVWWDDEDGKEIRVDLTEPGALYDYLVEYAAPEGVQEDEL